MADTSHVLYNTEPLFLTKNLNTGDVLILQFESFTPCYNSESSSDDYDQARIQCTASPALAGVLSSPKILIECK